MYENEKEQTETIARIAAHILKANSKNGAAIAKFCGINPDIGAAYSIEGNENYYFFTLPELKTAAKTAQIQLTVNL
mgnify:CR=1 FL=1